MINGEGRDGDEHMAENNAEIQDTSPEKEKAAAMTWQQKAWKYGKLFYRAFSPMILLLLLPGAFRVLVKGIFGTDPDDRNGDFYYAIGLYCYLWLFARRQKKRGKMIGDWIGFYSWETDRGRIIFYLTRGIALNLMLTGLLSWLTSFSFLERLSLLRGYEEQTHDLTRDTNAILVFAAICVLAPIAEEITLRGAMLREFLTVLPSEKAIFLVSLIFAAGHGNLIWTLYTFCFGIYLARTTVKENMRLIFPIILHCGFNLPSLVTYFIRNSGRSVRLLKRYPSLYLLYGLLGAGLFAWSGWVSRSHGERDLVSQPEEPEGGKTTV